MNSFPKYYTNDCSSRAIVRIAEKEGYADVNKETFDAHIMLLNKKYDGNYQDQASVDMVQCVCARFGWAIDIVVRITNANGDVTVDRYLSPHRGKHWSPMHVLGLEYNNATGSGHYEPCNRQALIDTKRVKDNGFAWAYLR